MICIKLYAVALLLTSIHNRNKRDSRVTKFLTGAEKCLYLIPIFVPFLLSVAFPVKTPKEQVSPSTSADAKS